VVLERLVGVAHGDVVEGRITAVSRRPEEQLEVHHVVDDDQVGPGGVGTLAPRAERADAGVEAAGERLGGGEQDRDERAVARGAQGVAEAREDLEADVVVTRVELLPLHGPRARERAALQVVVSRAVEQRPQATGEEAAGPPLRGARPHRAVGMQAPREERVRDGVVERAILAHGLVQRGSDHRRQLPISRGPLGAAGQEGAGEENHPEERGAPTAMGLDRHPPPSYRPEGAGNARLPEKKGRTCFSTRSSTRSMWLPGS
jgi:hypothetical protein